MPRGHGKLIPHVQLLVALAGPITDHDVYPSAEPEKDYRALFKELSRAFYKRHGISPRSLLAKIRRAQRAAAEGGGNGHSLSAAA